MKRYGHGLDVITLPILKHPDNWSGPALNMSGRMVGESMSGHIAASLTWFFVGFIYIVLALRRHYTSQLAGHKFFSSVEFPFDFLPGRLHNLPFVALFKIVGALVFLSLELHGTLVRESGCVPTSVWQHETMATIFLMSGVADIVLLKSKSLRLFPDGTDYLLFGVTFGVQAMQFTYHLDGRPPLSARLHAFQALLAGLCAVSLVMEAGNRRQAMMPVIRGYFIMMQGTWMMHLMFILYHPGSEELTWDLHSDESVTLASLIFMYHMVFDMILVLIVNLVLSKVFTGSPYEVLPLNDRYDRESKWQLMAMEQLATAGDQPQNGHDGGYDVAFNDGGDENNFDSTKSSKKQTLLP